MPNFSFLAWLEVCQEPPIIISDLEDIEGFWLETWRTWVIIDFIFFLDIGFLTCVQNFRILAWLEMCQEPPCHHQWLGGHWWFPTRDMENKDQPWPQNCSWYMIPDLSAKFQLSTMIKSVSRTPSPWWGYLEMLRVPDRKLGGKCYPWHHRYPLGDMKEDILRVLWHLLYFWLRYKCVLPW